MSVARFLSLADPPSNLDGRYCKLSGWLGRAYLPILACACVMLLVLTAQFLERGTERGVENTQATVKVTLQESALKPFLEGEQTRNRDCAMCPICGKRLLTKDKCSGHVRYFANKQFYDHDPYAARLYQCNHCEHVFVWPILNHAELGDLYRTRYHNQVDAAVASVRAVQQHQLIWDQWTQFGTGHESKLTVAELGCARGFLLAQFEEVADHLFCFEPDPDMKMKEHLKHPNKLKVIQRPYMTPGDLPDRSVHIWMASHVVEHIANPLEAMVSIQRTMVPGGLVFFEVPTYKVPADVAEELPSHFHLSYFTAGSLDIAMTQAGFCRLFVGYVPNGQIIGNTRPQWQEEAEGKSNRRNMRVVYQNCVTS